MKLARLTLYALALLVTSSAHATYIVKSWLVTGTETPWLGGTEAVPPVPTTGLDATAVSGTVNWNIASGSLMNFLQSDPTTTVTSCLTTTVGAVTYNCATEAISTGTATTQSPTTYGQILEITGVETFVGGTTYSFTHDDGLTVSIDGTTVISSPGAQSNAVSTFTTTSGVHTIDIVYGECCGAPATLTSNLPVNPVPEPGVLALAGIGLVGILASKRRRVRS